MKYLLVQLPTEPDRSEDLAVETQAVVTHCTSDPIEWIDTDLRRVANVDAVVVTAPALAFDSEIADSIKKMIGQYEVLLYIDGGHLVPLESDEDVDDV